MNQPKVILHKGKFLALVKEGHWEYADRTNPTGAAIVIAVTDQQKLLLVEQYRTPVHARTIELPAGISGDESGRAHENHAEAARRELEEETGYPISNYTGQIGFQGKLLRVRPINPSGPFDITFFNFLSDQFFRFTLRLFLIGE